MIRPITTRYPFRPGLPAWARPHIPEAVGAGALVAVAIMLAWWLL